MQELIEHIIVVDKYIKVSMMIPKELDAIELSGIFTKAKKLFSLSEIEIQQTPREGAESRPLTEGGRERKITASYQWSQEQTAFLIEQMQQGGSINEMMGKLNAKFGTTLNYMQVYTKKRGIEKRAKGGN